MKQWRSLVTLVLGVGVAMASMMGCNRCSEDPGPRPPNTDGGPGEGGAGGAEQGGAGGGQGGSDSEPLADGEKCTKAGACQTGFCVDGVCCNVACDGECQACTGKLKNDNKDGVCGQIPAGLDPENECPLESQGTCGRDGVCGSDGSCRRYVAGTTCGDVAACTGGEQTGADLCDGSGTCVDAGSWQCGSYTCDATGTMCLRSCTTNTDCSAGYYCDALGECVEQEMIGESCSDAEDCQSGHCADGVCCNAACDGECQRCNAAGSAGTCQPFAQGAVDPECTAPTTTCNATQMCSLPAGAACTMGSECASGTCTAGACAP